MARQQRRVEVQEAVPRHVEEGLRHDLAEVGEDPEVRLKLADRLERPRVANVGRLHQRDAALPGGRCDRDRRDDPPTSGGLRGRADDADDLDVREVAEAVQDGDGEPAAAQEHDPSRRVGHARAFAASSTSSSSP